MLTTIIFILLAIFTSVSNWNSLESQHRQLLKKIIYSRKLATQYSKLHYLDHLIRNSILRQATASSDTANFNSMIPVLLHVAPSDVEHFLNNVVQNGHLVHLERKKRYKRALSKYPSKNVIASKISENAKIIKEAAVKRSKHRNVPIARLILDPNIKLDLEQVADNVREVIKDDIEQADGNLYHLLNMIGSFRDSLISAINIIPIEAFVPSSYAIVPKDEQERSENINKIKKTSLQNMNFYKRASSSDFTEMANEEVSADETEMALKKLSAVLVNSVDSTKRSIGHMSEMLQSAKSFVHNVGKTAPKIILNKKHYVPVVKVS